MHPARRTRDKPATSPSDRAESSRADDLVPGGAGVLRTSESGDLQLDEVSLVDMQPVEGMSTATGADDTTPLAVAMPDYSEDRDDDTINRTRTEIEAELRAAQLMPVSEPALLQQLLADARQFPDIAQAPLAQIPAWTLSELRKTSAAPLASRYVFVPAMQVANAAGLYRVTVMHQGATLMVSRASRFQGRVIHDPFSLEAREFDLVVTAFLKTFVFLKDPVAQARIGTEEDTPENRAKLASSYRDATGSDPYGTASAAVQPNAALAVADVFRAPPKSPQASEVVQHGTAAQEPTVTYRRRRAGL